MGLNGQLMVISSKQVDTTFGVKSSIQDVHCHSVTQSGDWLIGCCEFFLAPDPDFIFISSPRRKINEQKYLKVKTFQIDINQVEAKVPS